MRFHLWPIGVLSLASSVSMAADLMLTELADPNNLSSARFVEIYNPSADSVTLDGVYSLRRWTNGNTNPQPDRGLSGTVPGLGFFYVCRNGGIFSTTYNRACDDSIGAGGPADSNGDDNIALIKNGAILDLFGAAGGEDGSGTQEGTDEPG